MFPVSRSSMTTILYTIMTFLTILFAIVPTTALPVALPEIAQDVVVQSRSNSANQPSSLLGRVYHVESRNDVLSSSSSLVVKEENEESQWNRRVSSDDDGERVVEFKPLARAEKFHRRMSMKARMDAA